MHKAGRAACVSAVGVDTGSETVVFAWEGDELKGRIFIVMGKSATGKDTIYARLLRDHPEISPVIPYTTRPIREGERDGEEYHFVDEETMRSLEGEGRVIESRCYHTVRGDWYYFTVDDDQLTGEENHIMITTLEGYEGVRDYFGKDKVIPIYIEVDDMVRIERALNRERKEKKPCVAEVCRRFLADEQDFSVEKLVSAGIDHAIVNDDLEKALANIEQMMLQYL
ncbi:MAG: guanylate kinase [Eubacterium sp.]|nr:guanylate kinase [Eubacterium sp.]